LIFQYFLRAVRAGLTGRGGTWGGARKKQKKGACSIEHALGAGGRITTAWGGGGSGAAGWMVGVGNSTPRPQLPTQG